MKKHYLLSCLLFFLLFNQNGYSQCYNVTTIAYNPFPYNSGTSLVGFPDDRYSFAIPIGFNFCFYGNQYTTLLIGANCNLNFDTTYSNTVNDNWNIMSSYAIPSTINPYKKEVIMFPWQDLYIPMNGQINYFTNGVAPNRKFVVSFDSVAMYASSSGYFTGQVVLNETSNSIEFYIKHKEVVSSWNGGLAIQGIQGVNGTQGTIAPGRNATQWTATNDALLFSPTCTVCSPLTSIQAYGLNDKILVYPNPTNSIVAVIGVEGNAIITVYNVIGETVLTQQITKEKTEIDLSKETNGIYFIKITNENGLLTKKIIKE